MALSSEKNPKEARAPGAFFVPAGSNDGPEPTRIDAMIKTEFKFDKSAFSISTLGEKPNDRAYWLSRPPQERFAAMELMRQINYDYDPVTDRIQRVLEVVQRTQR